MHLESLTLGALNFSTLPEQLLNGIFLGAIYALIALGYTMVYGVLRLINFAHGEVYMLGAYVAYFAANAMGFGPGSTKEPSVVNLLIMLLASMIICAAVGVLIERFAYRPMRNHPRIASLITAIGLSLLLQYGGALVLPNSPPPSINEQVNPYRDTISFPPPPADLVAKVKALEKPAADAKDALTKYLADHPNESEYSIGDAGKPIADAKLKAESDLSDAKRLLSADRVSVTVRKSDLIILGTSVGLMILLTYLVMYTKAGRAMRAVSHDFDSAALMGINVNRIIVFTFVLGSALAGAGAMMQATFKGTTLTTFFGALPGVKAFVAAVLGGIGNIPGAVLGGMLMGLAETLVVWLGYGDFKDAIAFVILIGVLLFKPGGLMGSSKVEKV